MKCRCGEPLTAPDTGRPPTYCSTTCRRSAEYELRRHQQLLLKAQKAEQDARLHNAVGRRGYGAPNARDAAVAAFWEGEVERLSALLDSVLAADAAGQ